MFDEKSDAQLQEDVIQSMKGGQAKRYTMQEIKECLAGVRQFLIACSIVSKSIPEDWSHVAPIFNHEVRAGQALHDALMALTETGGGGDKMALSLSMSLNNLLNILSSGISAFGLSDRFQATWSYLESQPPILNIPYSEVN